MDVGQSKFISSDSQKLLLFEVIHFKWSFAEFYNHILLWQNCLIVLERLSNFLPKLKRFSKINYYTKNRQQFYDMMNGISSLNSKCEPQLFFKTISGQIGKYFNPSKLQN